MGEPALQFFDAQALRGGHVKLEVATRTGGRGEVRLVPDNGRLSLGPNGGRFERLVHGFSTVDGSVKQVQHDGCALGFVERPADAFALDFVGGFADARSVDEAELLAADNAGVFNGVARGAGGGAYDGALVS